MERGSVFVDQNTLARSLQVIELPVRQRPNEGGKTTQSKQQGDRDEKADPAHRAHRVSRSALTTTMIDEVDIAIAAISGVTSPSKASGTARIL